MRFVIYWLIRGAADALVGGFVMPTQVPLSPSVPSRG